MENFAAELGSENIYTVSAKAVSRVLESGSPDAARLLLYIMQEQDHFDRRRALRALQLDEARLSAALAVIREPSRGIPEQLTFSDTAPVSPPAKPDPGTAAVQLGAPPSYTRGELADAMRDSSFSYLCGQAEQAVGRPLRQYEMNALMTMYDYLGLPANVIALLINHVRQECERRSTPDHPRPVSFREIKAEATRWYERGIVTVLDAERSIEEERRRNSDMGRVMRILGIRDRLPSPTERRYIEEFLELDPSLELIPLAYDRTVTQKGSLVWPYMRSILRSWHEKGYDGDEKGPKASPASGSQGESGDDYSERVLEFFRQNNSKGE